MFCRISLNWNLCDVFHMSRCEFCVLGRKTIEVTCHFHHITLIPHSQVTYTVDVNTDHLAQALFLGFSAMKLPSPTPFRAVFLVMKLLSATYG